MKRDRNSVDILRISRIIMSLQPLPRALPVNRALWRKDVGRVKHGEAVSGGKAACVGIPDH